MAEQLLGYQLGTGKNLTKPTIHSPDRTDMRRCKPENSSQSTTDKASVKKRESGAHNSAWRIAYASVLLSIISFFLLMQALDPSEENNGSSLYDYFSSPREK